MNDMSMPPKDVPYIEIARNPPKYLYAREEFSFEYIVETRLKITTMSLMIMRPPSFSGVDAGSSTTANSFEVICDTMIHEDVPLGIAKRLVKGRIHLENVPPDGAMCNISLRPTDEGFASISTRDICIVVAKLRIDYVQWESPFYKNQGGRDKGQVVMVGAYDSNDSLLPQSMDLLPTIRYAEVGTPCDQQELIILQNNDERKHHLAACSRTKCKFRYISLSHHGLSYVVRFSAVGRGDIAPTYTEAVFVESKRPPPKYQTLLSQLHREDAAIDFTRTLPPLFEFMTDNDRMNDTHNKGLVNPGIPPELHGTTVGGRSFQQQPVQAANLSIGFESYMQVAKRFRRWLLVSLTATTTNPNAPASFLPYWPDETFWAHSEVKSTIAKCLISWSKSLTSDDGLDYLRVFAGDPPPGGPHLAIVNPDTWARCILARQDGKPLLPQDFCRQVRSFCDSFRHQSPRNSTVLRAFEPPNHLSHIVTNFGMLLRKCKAAQRWLIVNVQDDNLPSLTLNSEVWRHPVIESLILEGFVFWQTCDGFDGASWYKSQYNMEQLPHVAILDPESGEVVWRKEGWTWENRLMAEHFAETVVSLDKRRKKQSNKVASGSTSSAASAAAAATASLPSDRHEGAAASEAGSVSVGGTASWECLSLCDAWERLSMGRDDTSTLGSVAGGEEEEWEILDAPTHLLHTATTWKECVADSRNSHRPLLVNIQDDGPSARALNLDIWRDDRVENLIMEGFCMWQQPVDASEAKAYCKRFKVDTFPHVAILDCSNECILWRKDGWDWVVDEPWTVDLFADKLKEYTPSTSLPH